jgi:hypothetical protein
MFFPRKVLAPGPGVELIVETRFRNLCTFIYWKGSFTPFCFFCTIKLETIGLHGDVRVRMKIQFGRTNETHPLVHTHRHLHHVCCMQIQARGSSLACTTNALLHECSADALPPGLGCDGQKANLRAGERALLRRGEGGSRGVQENRPKNDSFLFSHDLLGRRYVGQRSQNILPISFPSGRRQNRCILVKGR